MNSAFKQFKLSNDDEIICEIIEWNDHENDAIIVRGVMKVVHVEDFEKAIRFYAFRPWMVFNDDPDELLTINSGHIVAEITPSKEIYEHYIRSLGELKDALSARKKRKTMSLDEVANKLSELDEEDFDAYIQQLSAEMDEVDSDMPENVIKFKPKGTYH